MESTRKYYRVDRRQICFLRFLFEAYDGIAALTTLDPAGGLVVLSISPGCEVDVALLLRDLGKDMLIEQMAGWDGETPE